jgi:hypothetical protein
MNFKELESYIELVGKTPNQCIENWRIRTDDGHRLCYLSTRGQGIYGIDPLTHYEVLQRGISKYIENKPKKEKSYVIQYFLGESYEPEYEKYFSMSWQKLHSPHPIRFIQLPKEGDPNSLSSTAVGGVLQIIYLKEIGSVRVGRPYTAVNLNNELNIESYHPLTHPQRRFLLDYIESYHIPPDRIFIDDHSEKQSIKRQLGLQFF